MKPGTSQPIGVIICFLLAALPNIGDGQTTDAPEAIELYRSASHSFQAREFAAAASEYQSLLNSHPEFTRKRDAHFYKGMAHYYLQEYLAAAKDLGWVRNSLPDLKAYQHSEQMLLYLAFCQHQAAMASPQPAQAKGIEDAVETFDQFIEKFADSELAPQAWYFKGQALEDQSQQAPGTDRLEQAIMAYQQVMNDHPKSNLQAPSRFAIGKCWEALANYGKAAETYEAYLNEYPNEPNEAEVRIRWANTLLQQGLAAQQSGRSKEAKDYFSRSDEIYQRLIDNPRYPARADAMNQKAYGRLLMEDYKSAADLYAQISNDHPSFEFAGEAALNAGKYYFSAGDISLAETWLNQVAQNDESRAPEATHWMCRIAIEKADFQEAIQLSKTQLESNPGNQVANLKMDMADAMFKIPNRQKEAVALYESIAKANPGQSLAAQASYNAAFGYLRLNEVEAALAAAEDFRKRYPNSELLPDTLEILGQAASNGKNYPLAKSTYESLISQFPNHPRHEWWQTQIARADLLDQKFTAAIDYLSLTLDQFKNPEMIAEAHALLSSGYMQLGNFDAVIKAIDNVIETDPDRNDLDRLQLRKARALAGQQDFDQAIEIAQRVQKNGNDEINGEANYLLGKLAAEMDHHQKAIGYFEYVVQKTPQDPWRPRALLDMSSSLVHLNQPNQAIQTLERLSNEYPNQPDSRNSILVRAKAYRMTGDIAKALADVDRFLETQPSPAEQFHAAYVKSLCQSDLQDWASVIATLTPLTQDLSVNSAFADDVIFYLAWAHQKNDQEIKSLELFGLLCDSYEESVHAAEANYHVGQSHYELEQYETAIKYFQTALNGDPTDTIGERAAYRLAWCFYQQAEYNQARKAFQQQTEQYPEGPLTPIGLSMLAESHFQLAQHAKAINVYKVAIPAIQSSEIQNNLRVLGPIHAAQSANQIEDFEAARKYAYLVIDNHPESTSIADAWFELGFAEKNLGEIEKSEMAWQMAMQSSLSETGAKARANLGQLYYEQGNFESALIQFKLVMNGYGGLESSPRVKRWQALAAYESARCYYAQSAQAKAPETRNALIQQTLASFEWLVRHCPDSPLVTEAKNQIKRLSAPPKKIK